MNVLAQTETNLKEQIRAAVLKAELRQETEIPDVVLEKPKDKSHGDFATNIAMQLARVSQKDLGKLLKLS